MTPHRVRSPRFRRIFRCGASAPVAAQRARGVALVALVAAALLGSRPTSAQGVRDSARVAIVYTGRSLGALGFRRAQEEHDLLAEQAVVERVPFKLVSHAAWRAPGIVVFLPSAEPAGDELSDVIARRADAERADTVHALSSANVLLLQDPWRPEPDLLAMLGRNARRASDFPDLVATRVTVSRLRSPRGDRVVIVEQPGAVWPEDLAAWTVGEINRIDVLDSRIFELPLNLGGVGPRATLLRSLRDSTAPRADLTITVDLGHQAGDLGIERAERARLDFTALRELGYRISVPYEFELGLGAAALASLAAEFPEITLLAANVRAPDSTLLRARHIVADGGVRIGLVGLVNPAVRDRLPRSALRDLVFESPVDAARREVSALRASGVDAVVVLSNLEVADNAAVAERVAGIDAIVADLPVRTAPEVMRTRVELPGRPYVRPGPPALVARGAANGLGVGRLDLEFRAHPERPGVVLRAVDHSFAVVSDLVAPDTALVRRLSALAVLVRPPRGELMFPAFVDLVARHPAVGEYDEVARQGRVSQPMWEAFMARLLRLRGSAEVAVIRRLDHFPPLIGKLHENEIAAWLWTEDEVVLVDLLGGDLRALLNADTRRELATSGIDLAAGTIHGRGIDDATFYRVATSDVLYEGARSRYFERGRRVRRAFVIAQPDGELIATSAGSAVPIKDLVLGELRRVRARARGDEHLDQIAALVAPDPPFVNLLSFMFERPTLWASLNSVSGNAGYGSVPESRLIAPDAWVAGVSGRFVVSHDRRHSATDLGFGIAYAQQRITSGGPVRMTESSDDIKIDLTFRPSLRATAGRPRPFVRGLFDTEFSPTRDLVTGVSNPQQLALRGVAGFLLLPTLARRRAELGLAVENDFGRPNLQYGVQARLDVERRLSGSARVRINQVTYRMRNDLTYFLPAGQDTDADLALRYNMIHELIVPLVDELSLSIAADVLFFQGKVATTQTPGMSTQLRLGLTYDRRWKPRYQPFF